MSGYKYLMARGISDYHNEHVFGRNADVGTTYEIVSPDGIFRTPQFSSPQQLRIKAGNVNDDVAGTGARTITLIGMGTDYQVVTEIVNTAGASSGALTTQSFVRLFRAYVQDSGTFASVGTYSHAGDIVIETSAGEQWGCIDATDIPRGITQIGAFTVPDNIFDRITIKEAYISGYVLTVDSGKSADFLIVRRENANETTAPYTPMRVIREHLQVVDAVVVDLTVPLGPYPPGTDISIFAKAPTSAAVTMDLEIVLVKE